MLHRRYLKNLMFLFVFIDPLMLHVDLALFQRFYNSSHFLAGVSTEPIKKQESFFIIRIHLILNIFN